MTRAPSFTVVGALLCLLGLGCQDQTFVGLDGLLALAMTEDAAPFATGDDAAMYIVEARAELPLRVPSDGAMQALVEDAEGLEVPFPRLPWVERGDYELKVDWMVRNLEDRPVIVEVVLNGFNEFDEYVPGFTVDNDDIIPDFAQYERRLALDPLETRHGTVREEHLDEAAVDLATVVNGIENANLVMSPRSQSSLDPRVQPYIPPVIPALTGLRIGLRATTDGGPAPRLVLEATLRVRDLDDKVVDPDDAWELPVPTPFTPVPVL
jgi:hypothetical protein